MKSNRLDIFFKGIDSFCRILMIIQIIIISYVVFGRFVLNSTPSWGEELSLFCMVWFCLLSSALPIRDGTHLRITLLDLFLKDKTIKKIDLINSFLMAIFALFMIVEGIKFGILTWNNSMTGIKIPLTFLYMSIPLSGLLWLIALTEKFYKNLIKSKEIK